MVQSVSRAFTLLKLVARHPQGIGVMELAEQTGLHKSTVSRLLSTLEAERAVERVPQGKHYQVSQQFMTLFAQANLPQSLITLAQPYLHELQSATNEDAGLALPEGDYAVYVDQVFSQQPVQVRDWTGMRFPLHTVSAGKIFLAFMDEVVQEIYLKRPLEHYTPQTVTSPDKIRAEISQTRRQQVAWVIEEFAEGLTAVASPIFDSHNNVIAALSIYGPAFRFPAAPSDQIRINRLIRVAAQRLTQQVREIL
ncbi:MAG: IclR family transcriptional regulator [Chloroflexota bacterium]